MIKQKQVNGYMPEQDLETQKLKTEKLLLLLLDSNSNPADLTHFLDTQKEIHMNRSLFGKEEILCVLKALEKNKSVSYLCINSPKLDKECFEVLAKTLKNHPSITVLDLRFSDPAVTNTNAAVIDLEGAQSLAKILGENSILREFSLGYAEISTQSADCLAKALTKNSSLINLRFAHNKINSTDFQCLLKALEENITLRTLAIHHQPFRSEVAKALVPFLKKNRLLTHLDLSNSLINDNVLGILCPVLKVHPSLNSLNLNRNLIRMGNGPGFKSLLTFLRGNSVLTTLCLDNTHFMMHDFELLIQALEHSSLTTFSYNDNLTGDELIKKIAFMLEKHPTLTEVSLMNNVLTNKGAYILIETLKRNQNLIHLKLGYDKALGKSRLHPDNISESTLRELSAFLKAREHARTQTVRAAIQHLPKDLVDIIGKYLNFKEVSLLPSETTLKFPFVPVSAWVRFSYWLHTTWNRVRDFVKNISSKLRTKKSTQNSDQNSVSPTQIVPIIKSKVEMEKIGRAPPDFPFSTKTPKKR